MNIWIIDNDIIMEIAYFIYLKIKLFASCVTYHIDNKLLMLPIILTYFHRKMLTILSHLS